MFDAEKTIDILNLARSMELTAIAQYMQLHYYLNDKGYDMLAGGMKRIAIAEMRHAEQLAERIKQLKGVPCTYADGAPRLPGSLNDCYNYAQQLEMVTRSTYQGYVEQLAAVDEVSKQLLSRIAVEEADHLDYFEQVLDALSPAFEGVQRNGEYKD
jgi:bacterioferritin|uniref:Bacterioferritin n=1 Tax=Myoviridae sp. ctOAa14 TaxID=2826646 RepID=A0A8S5MR12_9CAUD|nr:MAG TPA: Bacterioferritin [Myoviridae sp. ctOAa14]